MKNLAIKNQLKEKKVFQWQVAKSMGISEMTLCRKLREELTEDEKQEIFSIINKLAGNNDKNNQKRRYNKMTLNVETETELDLSIKKIDEILEKLSLLEDKSKMLNFITIQEFAKLRKCSIKTAQDIFNDSFFPSENYGKTKVAEVEAVKNWYQTKRDKKNQKNNST